MRYVVLEKQNTAGVNKNTNVFNNAVMFRNLSLVKIKFEGLVVSESMRMREHYFFLNLDLS